MTFGPAPPVRPTRPWRWASRRRRRTDGPAVVVAAHRTDRRARYRRERGRAPGRPDLRPRDASLGDPGARPGPRQPRGAAGAGARRTSRRAPVAAGPAGLARHDGGRDVHLDDLRVRRALRAAVPGARRAVRPVGMVAGRRVLRRRPARGPSQARHRSRTAFRVRAGARRRRAVRVDVARPGRPDGRPRHGTCGARRDRAGHQPGARPRPGPVPAVGPARRGDAVATAGLGLRARARRPGRDGRDQRRHRRAQRADRDPRRPVRARRRRSDRGARRRPGDHRVAVPAVLSRRAHRAGGRPSSGTRPTRRRRRSGR